MADVRYRVYFQFSNGPSDPRINVKDFHTLTYYNENIAYISSVVPSSPGDVHRNLFSFQTMDNFTDMRGYNEYDVNGEKLTEGLMKLVYTNTMHRLIVASLDDKSLSQSEKKGILSILASHKEMGFHHFEDFVRTSAKSKTDEIYLQNLCIAFITSYLDLDSPHTTSLRVQMLRVLFENYPPLPHSERAPHCSIEIADENSWLLTSYYPTPQKHRLFLGAPLELESPTGLRFHVHVIDNGSPSVTLSE
jgi:hypothetical protein